MANTRYEAARDKFLARIHQQLLADERIVAAWLTGSLGRGNADEVSDIDLTVIVSDHAAATLCERTRPVRAGTPPERLALFAASAGPAIIHENHRNAPDPGTFTAVVYEESGVTVDWTLVPKTGTCRPPNSTLLFERQSVPVCQGRSLHSQTERDQRIAERAAFFWMMIPQAIKSLYRDDLVYFHVLLHMLEQTRDELAARVQERPHRYRKGSELLPSQTRQQGKAVILDLCREVSALFDEFEGGSDVQGVSGDPMAIIGRLLQVLDEGSTPGKADDTSAAT
jgi:hypothetical protein